MDSARTRRRSGGIRTATDPVPAPPWSALADDRPRPPGRVAVTVLVDGPTTDGAFAVLEVRLQAGTVVPPHTHAREDATLLVLSGELEVVCVAERSVLRAGDHTSLPRSSPCRVWARVDARLLCLVVPAGLEARADLTTAERPVDPDDLAALLTAAGVSLLPAGWGAAA